MLDQINTYDGARGVILAASMLFQGNEVFTFNQGWEANVYRTGPTWEMKPRGQVLL